MPLRHWYHALLSRYLATRIPPGSRVVVVGEDPARASGDELLLPEAEVVRCSADDAPAALRDRPTDHVILYGTIHRVPDIQSHLEALQLAMGASTRLTLVFYSALWRPLLALASRLGVRRLAPAGSWVSPEDVVNLLALSGFEQVRIERKVLLPLPLPLLSWLCNRLLAPLPLLNAACLVNIVVARARKPPPGAPPSVSVVVPARNEAGNIPALLARLPPMGPQDEVIFIEGHSTDGTYEAIERALAGYHGPLRLRLARQTGTGKGDAVRAGFAMAGNEILMILDADLTVPPEELPRFYHVISEGRGEFVNGSRLVYPLEAQAMQFANLIANKGFALAFSFLLGQRFKDTLCGTKALSREHYRLIAANRGRFGDFDPFGDFDLLFGAALLGLKIIEVPVHYRERTYGTTNIQRWRHGLLLARMVLFAARRLTFT
jgi:hypothetical protein